MSEAEMAAPPKPVAARDRDCFSCPSPSTCVVYRVDDCRYLWPELDTGRKQHEPTGIVGGYGADPAVYMRDYRKNPAIKASQAEYRRTHKEQRNRIQQAWRARKKVKDGTD